MTRLAPALVALALAACQAAPAEGALCVRTSECEAPLTCALGRCRAACVTSADCGPRARCLVDPRSGSAACSLDVDSCATHDCPLGFACRDDECRNACDATFTCPDGVCSDGACLPVRDDAGAAGDGGRDAGQDLDGSVCSGSACREVVALGAGEGHFCAIRRDGTLWCWGHSDQGQLGDRLVAHGACPDCSPTPVQALDASGVALDSVTDVTGGGGSSCVVIGGEASCWSLMAGSFDPVPVARSGGPLTDVREVDAAHASVCMRVGATGEVWCAGENGAGQLGDLTHVASTLAVAATELGPGARALSTSQSHSMVLLDDGTIRGVGNNTAWELGLAQDADQLTGVVAPFPPADAMQTCAIHTCAIFGHGTTLGCWGVVGPMLGPTATGLPCAQGMCEASVQLLSHPAGVTFAGLAVAFDAVCAWTPTGEVYCAGQGPTLPAATSALVQQPLLAHVAEIVASEAAMCARTDAGEVYCWGSQQWGQLGDGVVSATGASAVPTRVQIP